MVDGMNGGIGGDIGDSGDLLGRSRSRVPPRPCPYTFSVEDRREAGWIKVWARANGLWSLAGLASIPFLALKGCVYDLPSLTSPEWRMEHTLLAMLLVSCMCFVTLACAWKIFARRLFIVDGSMVYAGWVFLGSDQTRAFEYGKIENLQLRYLAPSFLLLPLGRWREDMGEEEWREYAEDKGFTVLAFDYEGKTYRCLRKITRGMAEAIIAEIERLAARYAARG